MSTIKDILVQGVKSGTGIKAGIMGWSIAGKTGTAHKFVEGEYSQSKYISNFAGFFPAEEPQIVGVIILDEPRYGLHWGGYGAAPVFRRVAQRIINMDDSIQYHKPKTKFSKPVYVDASKKDNIGLVPIKTIAPYPTYQDGYTFVPDVRGMSIRKAKRVLMDSNIRASFTGSGHVVWQSPSPGTKKLPGSICTMGLN
jgi:membrane peptidoglycan carboxypeptidase